MHVVISSRRGGSGGGASCSVVVVSGGGGGGGGVVDATPRGAAAAAAKPSPSPIAASAPRGGLSLRRQLVEGSGGVGVGSPRAAAASASASPRSQHRAPAHRVLENLLSRSESWFGSPQRSPSPHPPQAGAVSDAAPSSPVVRRSEGYPGLETTLGTVPVVAEAAAAAATADSPPSPLQSPPASTGKLRRRTSRRHGFGGGGGARGAVTHCAARCRVEEREEEEEEEEVVVATQPREAADSSLSPLPLPPVSGGCGREEAPLLARPTLPSPLPLTPLRPSAASSCSPPPPPAAAAALYSSSSPSPSRSAVLPQPPLVPPTIRGRSVTLVPLEGHTRRLRLREPSSCAAGGGVRGTVVLAHAVPAAEAGLVAGEVTGKAVCLVSQPLAPCSRVLLAVSGFLDPRTCVTAGVTAAAGTKTGDHHHHCSDDDLVWVCGGAHNGAPRKHSFPFAPKRLHRVAEGGASSPVAVLAVARSATAVTMAVVRGGDGDVGGVAGPGEGIGPSWTVPRGAAVEVRLELYPGDEAFVLDAGLTLGGPGARELALASDDADAVDAAAAAASPPRLSQQASPLRWSRAQSQSQSQSPSPFRYRAL